MKKSDLYREYARVVDMCEGTNVRPNTCVDLDGSRTDHFDNFTSNPDDYTFAITIIEGKPLFAGDKLWCISGNQREVTIEKLFNGTHLVATDGGMFALGNIKRYLSWNPPKSATITVTIPRPDTFGEWQTPGLTIGYKNHNQSSACFAAIREAMK